MRIFSILKVLLEAFASTSNAALQVFGEQIARKTLQLLSVNKEISPQGQSPLN